MVESQITKTARGFAVRHRGRRHHDVTEPLGAEQYQRALHAQARSGLCGGGCAATRSPARAAKLPDTTDEPVIAKVEVRFVARDLHFGAVGWLHRARSDRLRETLRAAAAVGAARRCRRADFRRAPGFDARRHRPRRGSPATSSPSRTSRRRSGGRTPRSRPAASNRRRASSPSSPRPTCSTPEQFNNIIVANVGSYPVRITRRRQRVTSVRSTSG